MEMFDNKISEVNRLGLAGKISNSWTLKSISLTV